MTFGDYAEARLTRANARAKVIELSADSYNTPVRELDADKLHYSCIATISRYLDAKTQGSDTEPHIADLKKVAEFYDAASTYEEYATNNDGYWIFAASAYFLTKNYGSTIVCLNKINQPDYFGTNAAILYNYLKHILLQDESIESLPTYTARPQNTLEDEFFARILNVVRAQVEECSSVKQLSRYSTLPEAIWHDELVAGRIPQILWPVQEAISQDGLLRGQSGFIQMPTGAGKTKSIELLLRARILAQKCRKAIYVAPMTALCDEVAKNLTKHLSDIATISRTSDVRVPQNTTFTNINRASISVITPEKLAYLVRHDPNLASNLDLIVFDEAHLIGDNSRGANFEVLLAHLLSISPPSRTQWILISAVVSNANQIAEWAFSDASLVVDREVPDTNRSYALVDTERTSITYYSEPQCQEVKFRLELRIDYHPLKQKRNGVERRYPDILPDSEYAAHDLGLYYANLLANRGSLAIYFPKPASIRKAFRRFSYLTRSGIPFSKIAGQCNEDECNKIAHLFAMHYGNDSEFIDGVQAGILPHYGDLPSSIKCSVESSFRSKYASTVICTSTLSQGVNLPLKYVIVTGFDLDRKVMTPRDFNNLIGRAGRSGHYTGGSTLILNTRRNVSALGAISSNQHSSLRCESTLWYVLFQEDRRYYSARTLTIANTVVDIILKHYGSDSLENKLFEYYLNQLGLDTKTATRLTKTKLGALSTIESYCATLIHEPLIDNNVTKLCSSTYAYHLASDFEKERLLQVFQQIAGKLISTEHSISVFYYKTQLDRTLGTQIFEWISSSEFQLFATSDCRDFNILASAFYKCRRDLFSSFELAEVQLALSCWVDGDSIKDTFDTIARFRKGSANRNGTKSARRPTLASIESLLMKSFAYHLEYFVSCVVDACAMSESEDLPHLVQMLRTCQHRIKYGVATPDEVQFCEQVLNDRMIAKDLRTLLASECYLNSGELQVFFESTKSRIRSYASSLPTYCETKIRTWLERSYSIF